LRPDACRQEHDDRTPNSHDVSAQNSAIPPASFSTPSSILSAATRENSSFPYLNYPRSVTYADVKISRYSGFQIAGSHHCECEVTDEQLGGITSFGGAGLVGVLPKICLNVLNRRNWLKVSRMYARGAEQWIG
jgi:hypothetical protein